MSVVTIVIIIGLVTMTASVFVTKSTGPLLADDWCWRVLAVGAIIYIAGWILHFWGM